MNPPAESSSGGVARGAGSAALKGALLIGVAVIIGVLLLQTVHDSSTGSATSTPTTKKKTTTTTTKPKSTTTTTTVAHEVIVPAELKVIVLNAGAASGDVGTMSTKLKQVGYTNQADANNWTGHTQTGNTVLCKPGLGQEAVALSQQVPLQGSSVKPLPTPPPPTYGYDADCVVAVGS